MRYFIFLMTIICALNCNAQINIELSKLVGKKWELVPSDKYRTICIEFTNTELVTTFTSKKTGEQVKRYHKYYLSDEDCNVFNNNNVGKKSRGKYIIKNLEGGVCVNYIKSMSDSELVLHRHCKYIVFGPPIGEEKYKRVNTVPKIIEGKTSQKNGGMVEAIK